MGTSPDKAHPYFPEKMIKSYQKKVSMFFPFKWIMTGIKKGDFKS
jgi:hypothetical protein